MTLEFRRARLDEEEAKMLHAWRNDPDTLKNSYRSEPVSWEDFWRQYQESLSQNHPVHFLALENEVACAHLRYETYETDQQCLLSINLAPAARGRGLAKDILKDCIRFLRAETDYLECWAEVFDSNIASQKSFLAAGYHEIQCLQKRIPESPKSFRIVQFRHWIRLPQKIQAVIFDFDGTLVESKGFLKDSYFKFLSAFGQSGTNEEFEALNGPSLSEIVQILKQKYALEESHQNLLAHYSAEILKHYWTVPMTPEVRRALEVAKSKSLRLGIASSNRKKIVTSWLEKQSAQSYFDVMVTSEDVARSKPSPDLYDRCIQQLAVKPEKAVVIEDAASGLEAALAAGAHCLYLGDSTTLPQHLRIQCQSIANISDLKEWIA